MYAKNITFGKDKSVTTEVLYVFDKARRAPSPWPAPLAARLPRAADVRQCAHSQKANAANATAAAAGLDTSSVSALVSSAFVEVLGLVNNPVQGVSNFISALGGDAQSAIASIAPATGASATGNVNSLLTLLAGR